MSQLDDMLALCPRAGRLAADVEARFRDASPDQIESISLESLEEALAMMCVLFFELRASADRTVATIVENDFFALSLIYVKRLMHASADEGAVLATLVSLLGQAVEEVGRSRNEVRPQLVAAYIMTAAVRNTRYQKRALNGIKHSIALNDDLYRSLDENVALPKILEEVRHRFRVN